MKLAHWLLTGFVVLSVGGFLPSAVENLSAQESGSTERPRFRLPFDPEPPEAGSVEDPEPGFPVPDDPLPQESGSIEKPEGPDPFKPDSPGPGEIPTKTPLDSAPSGRAPGDSAAEERGSQTFVTSSSPELILPVLILLAGGFLVGWALFRIGLFNPYAATLWPKRLELCIEIALRMDDFMTAYREENYNKCQMALDALNHLNGRRSILLSNEINASVNKFIELAVSAKVSKDDEAFQTEFNRQYERVIEALRVATRQEELSLEVLRSLTKAQGPHRKLREPDAEK